TRSPLVRLAWIRSSGSIGKPGGGSSVRKLHSAAARLPQATPNKRHMDMSLVAAARPKEPLTEAEKRDSIRLRMTMPRCELDRGHPAATPRFNPIPPVTRQLQAFPDG